MQTTTVSTTSPHLSEDEDYSAFLAQIQANAALLIASGSPLFTTGVTGLFDAFLLALPVGRQKHYTCNACRKFVSRYGNLVTISPEGVVTPLFWNAATAPPFPWKLYRLASSGHRVTLLSFGEQTDGKVTVQVAVTGQFNRVAFERRVFGISPDDLTECDLPAEGEELGSMDLDPFEAMDLVRLGEAMAPISSGEVISVTRELTPTGEVVETTIRNEKVIAAHPGYLITGCFGPLETPES